MKLLSFLNRYFTLTEKLIWSLSVLAITASFLLFDRESYVVLIASLIGITALIFCAKANPIGQALCIVFGLIYGAISFSYRYYGEMITYLAMTVPMAVFALISWLKNPYKGNRAEVKVNRLRRGEYLFAFFLSVLVMVVFYFILKYFNTANLIPSTLSVATSFMAVYLTCRRSPYYAIGYACNDVVLILLWTLASADDPRYASVIVCFLAFLVNDIYGFIGWKRLEKKQR